MLKIMIRRQQPMHCDKCGIWEATIVDSNGITRIGESRRGGTPDEAITLLITGNPDIFGKISISYE